MSKDPSARVSCYDCHHYKATLRGHRCAVKIKVNSKTIGAYELCRQKLEAETGNQWGGVFESERHLNEQHAIYKPQMILNDDMYCLYFKHRILRRIFYWWANVIQSGGK